MAQSVVTEPGHVSVERKGADSVVKCSVVLYIARVINQCARSDSRVFAAVDIQYQGSSAYRRVRIRAVEGSRSSANSSIEVLAHGSEERKPTEPGIPSTGGGEFKRVTAFSSVEQRVAAVGRGSDCSRLRCNCKAHQNERDEKEPAP